MDLASVVAALASVGVRVSGSNPNNNIQGDSSRACPTGLAGPEPSGTHNDPGQHFQQYLKIEFGTFCQVIAAPPSAFREGMRRKFRRGMFHIFAKKFHFGTPHLLDFQVAAWWLARLYACFPQVAPFALPVEVFALVHCHHTPTLPLHPPPPPRLTRLTSYKQELTHYYKRYGQAHQEHQAHQALINDLKHVGARCGHRTRVLVCA